MKLKLKQFKVEKIRNMLIKPNIFFMYQCVNSTTKNWFGFEKDLRGINLNYSKMSNNLLKVLLTKSIFKHLILSLNGPCFLMSLSDNNLKNKITIEKLLSINSLITFFFLKLNDRIYISNQLHRVQALDYLNYIKKMKDYLQVFLLYSFNYFSKKPNFTKN